MAKLIFGCGYLGRRVAGLWSAQGSRVIAVTRRPEKAAELKAEGIEALVGDIVTGPPLALVREVRTVLWAVGYDRANEAGNGASIHDVYVEGLRRAVACLPPDIERLIYISSTGVYGNFAGETVDEDSPCRPEREGGKACLAAEEVLRQSPFAERTVILRLAGLYGPGRIPRARDLVAGKPIDAPAAGWLNLVHVDDAARIVLAAETRAMPPRTYVVSDGHPVERRTYYETLARLLDAPPPQFVEPAADSPAALRAASDKRVSPARMFAELGAQLQYPSYREGLAAIVADQGRIRE